MNLAAVVTLLGIAQIVSWGTLYYSLTVLSIPIRHELGFSELMIFGAFSAGLLISGALAPAIGKRIDNRGGRGVMTTGSIVAALALVTVALAREPIVFTIGLMLAGVAMAACLYDPAFASLYQIAPDRYRRTVTGLTLFGGLASTVFWPLSNLLASTWGWREALLLFAALHIVVCVPIHLSVLPPAARHSEHSNPTDASAPKTHDYLKDSRFYWLAATFASASLVFSALSSFMIPALGTRGFSVDEAVWIAALIGPMQVLARIVEWVFAGQLSALNVGRVACALSIVGMLLLNLMPHSMLPGVLFAICYGATNGILTIVRGTVTVELFGPQQQGALLGALARPSFVTRAFAPALFAGALRLGVPMHVGLMALAGVSATGFFCFLMAGRSANAVAAVESTGGDVPRSR